jgi:glutathione peroxidase
LAVTNDPHQPHGRNPLTLILEEHHVPKLSDFTATTITGEEQPLDAYVGHVALVVNTASACGFTPQFEGLEKLYEKYVEQGLVVLGFPCNQFGSQDSGSNEEIGAFCQKNYGVTFPMFEKIEVNGDGAHPLYQWLREEKGGVLGDKIKWNFTKFLIGRDGTVLKRYGSTTKPEKIAADIEKALAS